MKETENNSKYEKSKFNIHLHKFAIKKTEHSSKMHLFQEKNKSGKEQKIKNR